MSFLAAAEKKLFKDHPKGLSLLAFSEFWERFSFYGMRALLVLYMTKVMIDPSTGGLFSRADAYEVYGAYGALVYAFPVLGGLLADRFLGFRRAIGLGGVLMSIGHFLMAINDNRVFFLALAFLCVGNGFFKPNISSTVGTLYPPGDKRRDSGFTIFYMGINFGALLAPLVCGTLGEQISWHLGFSLAGVGMVIGLWFFLSGKERLEGKAEAPKEERLHERWMGIKRLHWVWIGAVFLTPIFALLLHRNEYLGYLLNVVGAVILGVLIRTAWRAPRIWGQRLVVLMVLMFFHTGFWAIYEQAGSSLTTLADRHVDRVVGDLPLDSEGVGKTVKDLHLTQAHWGRSFRNVTITKEHVRIDQEGEEQDGIPFSKIPLSRAFLGTSFRSVSVTFDYGGTLFKDHAIDESDVGKTFGDVQLAIVRREPGGGWAPLGKRPLSDVVQGPGGLGARLARMPVEPKHRGVLISCTGGGPRFDELKVVPELLGIELERATATQEQIGKVLQKMVVSPIDSDNDKVLSSVVLDESHRGMGMGGFELKASQFQSVNPLFIVLLAPFFSMLWTALARRRKDPPTPMKFAFAMFLLSIGFFVLDLSGGFHHGGSIAAWWLVCSYFFQTSGELCLSPVGLSAVTRLAPPRIAGFAMGAWFLTMAFAHHFAAQIAKLTTGSPDGVSVSLSPVQQLENYTSVFHLVAMLAAGAGVLLVLLTPILTRMMHEDVEVSEA